MERSGRQAPLVGFAESKASKTGKRKQRSGRQAATMGFAVENVGKLIMMNEIAKPTTAVCHMLRSFQ